MPSLLHTFLTTQLGHFSMHAKYLTPNLFILEMFYEKIFGNITKLKNSIIHQMNYYENGEFIVD